MAGKFGTNDLYGNDLLLADNILTDVWAIVSAKAIIPVLRNA